MPVDNTHAIRLHMYLCRSITSECVPVDKLIYMLLIYMAFRMLEVRSMLS